MPVPESPEPPLPIDGFAHRHIGPDASEVARMREALGVDSVEDLIEQTVPASIHDRALALPDALTEHGATARLRELADQNRELVSLIGCGYHGTITPPVLRRNILENPAWYTAYTPYQPEISQGRLEALLNFQTLVSDLAGLPLANASLLDEATAAAEAMVMLLRLARTDKTVFRVDAAVHPQTLAVIRTRAEPIGIEIRIAERSTPVEDDVFGVLYQYPGTSGEVYDLDPLVEQANQAGALTAAAADLLALVLLRAPGDAGVDVVVGSSQRFGVPMGCGGPHAAFIAARAGAERQLPGRVVGVSLDTEGRPALRLALQTREQHIRRDKATSNICTAQVLLAVMASMYACWHGPDGLRLIAERVHRSAGRIAAGLFHRGIAIRHSTWFDTITAEVPGRAEEVVDRALERGINLRLLDDDTVSISVDETTDDGIVARALDAFEAVLPDGPLDSPLEGLRRTDEILAFEPFHRYRSETEMLRYLRGLADKDLALDRTMIPLGSCTMKLNATTEMEPISWPEFANIHPFAPAEQRAGTASLVEELEGWLAEITGYAAVSIQPNAGSQGELAGLLAIRGWHRANGDEHRSVCLIPSSAHGTNAASAVMAGMRVVVVACDDQGDVDLGDLRQKIQDHGPDLAAMMITYPSTHGVFEAAVRELCAAVHDAGGQVYVDGANLNAMVGLARPGRFGADVSHLNLHKTFCIPHGGGGPGVGPVAVGEHLVPYLPSHPVGVQAGGSDDRRGPVISAAPWGSAGILPISHTYVAMMGATGLRRASEIAVLSANYIAERLDPYFPVLYRGADGRVAHECILDLRPARERTGITVDDVAKRLIDYGFHAPTMSFPVAGTLMVEPTESESLVEIDRFCDAMIAIAGEIDRVEAGEWPADDNPLVHAPHTAEAVSADEWEHPYPRSVGAWPSGSGGAKYWPPVSRIDGAHGDRNFVCSCPPIEDLAEPTVSDERVEEGVGA
ncbi:MAG: aminomethyl-transferring glycine dehydrogenase [Actinomycetota bacterium]